MINYGIVVSIPQWCDCCLLDVKVDQRSGKSFNPTMVRLLHQKCYLKRCGILQFQSHNGAIAACRLVRPDTSDRRFNPTMVRLLQVTIAMERARARLFQSHNGAIAAKAKFWDLRAKGKEMVKGLQSTFGCLKTLRGSTATGLSKLGYFGLKLPPHLYLAFKVLKTA